MSDYQEHLERLDPRVKDTLEASFHEAARIISPGALKNYIEGARALSELGRGAELVLAYVQQMPLVCKEVGDEVIADVVSGVMKLASMVSGAVIERLFDSLPTAARRLGDGELLRQYLGLIHQLSAKAPRGLRPMLDHLDPLFDKLTLGGLRRWALWGAQAHARDLETLAKYFALETADSLAVLQQERRGTLFVDTQRKLNFYLRALWGRDFYLRPTSGDFETREGYKPYIEHGVIFVPDAYDDFGPVSGKELYRATAAHAAAHLAYTIRPLSAEQLTPVQMFLIGLFEDARVEALAIREFPGLKQLWAPLFEAALGSDRNADPMVLWLERLAHALLDERIGADDPIVAELRESFHAALAKDPADNRLSWDLGVTLSNRIKDRWGLPSLRVLESFGVPYRDDNRFLWTFGETEWAEADHIAAGQRQVRRKVSLMEMIDEIDCELAGDDAQEIWTLETPFYLDQEGCTINELEGKEPVSDPYHYPEWDYQVQLHRPNWATVLERRQAKDDPALIERILLEYKPVASRLKHIIDALQPQGVIRQRRREDGDEIDLNAAIRAMIDIRMGEMPDPRINIRTIRKTRDLAVLLLLDLSESTNETLPGSDRPIIQLAREACTLLAWAIDGIGDPFAIHGFASDGRHDVQYYRFKDFDQPFDDQAKSRIAGMKGGLSTRMGAAMRHAAHHLRHRPQQRKLLLLVSDGEPADIDERDPQYLRLDTKKAVEELASSGIMTYCLTLDPDADAYVSRIFGPNRYTVVDHVQRLPERLPMLFAGLTA
ncbi:nitric oxide reductase activation protein NorD [Methylococcus capsulatus]|uniref:nitric oxide reductase activation protein NorD n=1 Tax=Methylococcus capsulatus TaxID=414 RepID=UPI002017D9EA|nr:nitric oxide reductase activation protein NorD [Methylococcus capsulatus]UQN11738.1 VWA domain-containing protein [Methylococcus capsulatus]